jgi:hypothetical protein
VHLADDGPPGRETVMQSYISLHADLLHEQFYQDQPWFLR